MVNPLVLGQGVPLFKGAKGIMKMRLLDAKVFKNGVVLLRYRPAKSE